MFRFVLIDCILFCSCSVLLLLCTCSFSLFLSFVEFSYIFYFAKFSFRRLCSVSCCSDLFYSILFRSACFDYVRFYFVRCVVPFCFWLEMFVFVLFYSGPICFALVYYCFVLKVKTLHIICVQKRLRRKICVCYTFFKFN